MSNTIEMKVAEIIIEAEVIETDMVVSVAGSRNEIGFINGLNRQ